MHHGNLVTEINFGYSESDEQMKFTEAINMPGFITVENF